ncbi:hypothetical protein [Agrobacterium fabrum]|uniref:hypothetical protein n=1 Tax=Agrobacterium fabrum TaxID=1176649 RepID=UPI00215885F3|nr:hypothetical protein [Agrobacterium fabrum]MCR6727820.1 hypothetical protein [Agrobacterium fabrum]
MKICVDVAEAAVRLEELIDLALRQDDVVISRSDRPVALLAALSDEEKQRLATNERMSGQRT